MCNSGVNDQKIRVFEIGRPDYPGAKWVTGDWATIADSEFDGAEDGDIITVRLRIMTQDQYDSLPEFEGW